MDGGRRQNGAEEHNLEMTQKNAEEEKRKKWKQK